MVDERRPSDAEQPDRGAGSGTNGPGAGEPDEGAPSGEAGGDGGGAGRRAGTSSGRGGPGERRRGRSEGTWGETLHGVQEAVGDMVGEVLDGVRDVAAGRRFPRVDVLRLEGEGYRVLVDLPGVQKDDLEVTTMGAELTVAGRRPPHETPEDADVLRSERGHGTFRRSIRLPADAREDDVRATLEDGVLVIRVPLAEPDDARRVEID